MAAYFAREESFKITPGHHETLACVESTEQSRRSQAYVH
jgi:hypothetical protein